MTLRSLFIFVGFGLIMILCAFVGWSQLNEPLGITDIAYRSFKALTLSDSYDTVGSKNIFIEISRWIGVGLFSTAAIGVVAQLFKTQWLGLKPAWRKDHILIVGDTPFAHALATSAAQRGEKTIHIFKDAAFSEHGALLTVPLADAHWRNSIRDAKTILLALKEDAETINCAAQAVHLTQSLAPKADILVRLKDSWLAQSLHRLTGFDRVRSFSELSLAARDIMQRHPPYLLAEDNNQKAIHCHIMGDDDATETLITALLLGGLTHRFGTPTVYVQVQNNAAFEQTLMTRYPALNDSICLVFDAPPKDVLLTATYVAFEDATRSLHEAMLWCEMAMRKGGPKAPTFVLTPHKGLYRPTVADILPDYVLVPFGGSDDIIEALELFSTDADAIAKAYHQSYLNTLFALYPDAKDENKPANRPWHRLPEQYRSANRKAAAHLPAKLFDAGFDIRPWLSKAEKRHKLPALAEPFYRNDLELSRLGEVEHLRWNADRRIMGWVYGPKRDNDRLIHPNLTDYAALDDNTKAFDLDMIKHISDTLPKSASGLKRAR